MTIHRIEGEGVARENYLLDRRQTFTHLGLLQTALVLDLFEAGGVDAVSGTYADRALRDTASRWRGALDDLP